MVTAGVFLIIRSGPLFEGSPFALTVVTILGATSGFTLVQLIETSNVTAHFCDHSGEAYFDIFSCKDFDENVALEVIDRHFEPTVCETRSLTRQATRAEVAARSRTQSEADSPSESGRRPEAANVTG